VKIVSPSPAAVVRKRIEASPASRESWSYDLTGSKKYGSRNGELVWTFCDPCSNAQILIRQDAPGSRRFSFTTINALPGGPIHVGGHQGYASHGRFDTSDLSELDRLLKAAEAWI